MATKSTKRTVRKKPVKRSMDLCKMIEVASRHGVSYLKYGGVEMEFHPPPGRVDAVQDAPAIEDFEPRKADDPNPSEMSEAQAKAKAIQLQNDYEAFLAEVQLANPGLYERLVFRETEET